MATSSWHKAVATPVYRGDVLRNSLKSQHSPLEPQHEAIIIFITVFMSSWHDLMILSSEGHKEKW